jgi:hypothetical protein
MTEKYVYIDFEGYLTHCELKNRIDKRISELKYQGFNHDQIMTIIFEDSHFKRCVFTKQYRNHLRIEFS